MLRPLNEILQDITYVFVSVERAKRGVEVPKLHAIYCSLEDNRVQIFYHTHVAPDEDCIEKLTSMTGEIMSDFDISVVDESWGVDKPVERKNMFIWIINP